MDFWFSETLAAVGILQSSRSRPSHAVRTRCTGAGPPGSGKSTLALGLIRQGWGYLTDDAVLLRKSEGDIHAYALRKHFAVDGGDAHRHRDLPLGELLPDNDGGERRAIKLEDSRFSNQHRDECIPQLMLFSRIVPKERSELVPIDHAAALKTLLEASGTQLFDSQTMNDHFELLKQLLKQTAIFELRAGLDVYRDAAALLPLLGGV